MFNYRLFSSRKLTILNMQLFTNKFVCVKLMRQNPLIAGGGGSHRGQGGGSHITTPQAESSQPHEASLILQIQTSDRPTYDSSNYQFCNWWSNDLDSRKLHPGLIE
jgi:hypothetical protein